MTAVRFIVLGRDEHGDVSGEREPDGDTLPDLIQGRGDAPPVTGDLSTRVKYGWCVKGG